MNVWYFIHVVKANDLLLFNIDEITLKNQEKFLWETTKSFFLVWISFEKAY